MKLYIKAAEDDSNTFVEDLELKDIFDSLCDIICNNIVKDINDKLGKNVLSTSRIHPYSYGCYTYHETEAGKVYIYESETNDIMLNDDFEVSETSICDYDIGKYLSLHAFLWEFPNSLRIAIRDFPRSKEYEDSKYVLEPDFVETTYNSFLDAVFDLCNKNISLKSNDKEEEEYEEDEYVEDEYEEEMSYDEWYDSDASQDDGWTFLNKAESILKEKYPGCVFEEEPSVQGYQGSDLWWLTYQNNRYFIEFDWDDQMFEIYDDGPEYAAKDYANRFIKAIDSGEALEEE